MEKTDNKDSVYSNLARAALEECEERFRVFMETTNEGVVIHDRFKIIETNQAFADMFGFKLANVLGRDVLEFIAPDSRDVIMEKLLAGDENPLEVSGVKKGDALITVEFCSRIIPHGGDRINMTFFRQRPNNIQAEPTEPYACDQLDPLFEFAPDAYYLADETGAFVDVNNAVQDLFGLKKEFIIGKSFLKLKILAPDQIHKAARNLAINILGKPSEPDEYVIQRKDGRQIPVEISTQPVKLNEKNMLFGIVRDITEIKKNEEALKRAVKEIESLVEERQPEIKRENPNSKNKAVEC
jgi:PAS domain S-box-containing protein